MTRVKHTPASRKITGKKKVSPSQSQSLVTRERKRAEEQQEEQEEQAPNTQGRKRRCSKSGTAVLREISRY